MSLVNAKACGHRGALAWPLESGALLWRVWLAVALSACLFFQAMPAFAYGASECTASRFGTDLNCTANDVSITGIAVSGATGTCTGGGSVTLDLDLTVNFASPTRYDIGIFVANDGKNPQYLASSGGAASCSVAALPLTSPFLNANGNACGDGDNGINGGTGKGIVRMTGVTVPCQTNPASGGNLYIPYVVSWTQSAGEVCTGPNDPVPATKSKCNVSDPALNSVSVVVMPALSNTDGITTIAPGSSNTYTVTITNSTGQTITNAVFRDPAVANLTVGSVTCAASGGATCPAVSVAAMQGAGITIASMPDGGALTFTINATLSSSATGTLSNVASVTLNGATTSVTDTDTITPSVHHYELSVPASSLACIASPVTVTACTDSSSPCTSPSTAISGSTVTLAASAGTLGATALAFNASGVATTTLSHPTAANGSPVTVTLSGESIAAGNPRQCIQGGVSTVANSCTTTFNTAGFIVSSTAGGAATTIPTQVAGLDSSTYYLRAVRSSSTTSACAAALGPGTTAVNFGYECNNPTVCSPSNLMSVNGGVSTPIARNNNGSVASYSAVNLTFDANGNAPFAVNYEDVGLVRLWMTKPASGSLLTSLSGSSNSFVVKPDHFDISAVQRSSDSFVNPAATGAGGSIFIKAGAAFSATVTAMSATGAVTPNYGKETTPQGVLLTSALVSPAGGANPALSNNLIGGIEFGATGQVAGEANGVASVTNLAWGEAGIISLIPTASNAGANNYLGGGTVLGATTGVTGNIGRFVPDHFDNFISGGTACPSGLTCPCPIGSVCPPATSNGFVYSGQAFTTNVTARNLAGATTTNYDSARGYSKPVTLTAWNAAASSSTQNPPGAPSAGSFAAGTTAVAASAFSLGSTSGGTPPLPNYSLPNIYPSATPPPGPTDIFMRAIDTDGTSSLRGSASVENGIKIVSGRITMNNAHGSELQQLPIGVTAQYWNGTRYVTSDTHSFSMPVASVLFGNCMKNLLASGACKPAPVVDIVTPPNPIFITNGVGSFKMRAPGTGNYGSADLTISLFPYLPSTTNRATFGIYKAGPIIYIREMY